MIQINTINPGINLEDLDLFGIYDNPWQMIYPTGNPVSITFTLNEDNEDTQGSIIPMDEFQRLLDADQ